MKYKIGNLRVLLKKQKGLCALSGRKLNPDNVTIDHIIPLSRTDLKNSPLYGKVWLVHKEVNKIKSNLLLEDMYDLSKDILDFKTKSGEILKEVSEVGEQLTREEFEKFVNENFDDNGEIK